MALTKVLQGILKGFTERHGLAAMPEDKLYEYLVNYLVVTKFHPEAFDDPSDLRQVDVDQGAMFGLDGIAFIVNGNLVLSKSDIEQYSRSKNLDVKVLLVQTKREEKFDSGSLLKTFQAVKSFLTDGRLLEDNENIENAREILAELFEFKNSKFFSTRTPECLVYYVTGARMCSDDLIERLRLAEESNIKKAVPDIKEVKVFALGTDFVIETFNELESRIEVQINFRNNLSLDKIGNVEQSYLGYLPGSEYLKVITDKEGNLRRRLFYENVRDFQGEANEVNREIRQTVTCKELRDKFILLNNGVTIVAKHFRSLGSNTYEMRDFQIVNGCQTSNELFLCGPDANEVLVPVKIIHTLDADLISRIVRATNSQTPVPVEAFVALEKYHKLLQETFEAYSKEMPVGVYYERRSREYDFAEKKLLQHQVVTLHALIRAITCVYFTDAYVVYNNNPANILRSRFDRLFRDEHRPEAYYVANYLLAKLVDLQRTGVLSSGDYINRYYLVMVVRFLLAGSAETLPLNSKSLETQARQVIDVLRADGKPVEDAYLAAKDLVVKSITQFRITRAGLRGDLIRRSPAFNDMVLNNVALALEGR